MIIVIIIHQHDRWLQEQSVGSFSHISAVMESDLCMHLFLVAGGPWFLFSKVLYIVIFEGFVGEYTRGLLLKYGKYTDFFLFFLQ